MDIFITSLSARILDEIVEYGPTKRLHGQLHYNVSLKFHNVKTIDHPRQN